MITADDVRILLDYDPDSPMVDDGKPSKDTTLTPLNLIAALGEFDLDPCGFVGHQTARELIVLPDDGLVLPWRGRVWLNPPYSNPLPWIKRLADHQNGCALVLASTDTRWFQDYVAVKAAAVLFQRGRPTFYRYDMSPVGLMRATCIVAYGEENAAALANSGLKGWLACTAELNKITKDSACVS